MLILRIILSFMKIGLLSFGGAYASIPLVEKEIVEIQKWMTYSEFADLVALDELTPGPIIINCATFIGMKVSGIPGAVAATLGCVLPSCIISLLLILIYRRYKKVTIMESALHALKCMAVAMILSSFLKIVINSITQGTIMISNLNIIAVFLITVSFIILHKYKVSPLYIMLGCGIINLICGIV